jgi:hypothetical protein
MYSPIGSPPVPADSVEAERWTHTSLRYRMLTGEWEEDAKDEITRFFSADVVQFLPPADISRNSFLQVIGQTSTLYDEQPALSVESEPDTQALGLDTLWPLMQEVCEFTRGLNECLVRLDWNAALGQVSYRTVYPHMVTGVVVDSETGLVLALEELRSRRDPQTGEVHWTWDCWDVRGESPTYRIYMQEAGKERVDVTERYHLDASGRPSTAYPPQFIDSSGNAFIPYVIHHQRPGQHQIWAPKRGVELVAGALTEACYWTFWAAGLRDGSFPVRVLFDAMIEGMKQSQVTAANRVDYIPIDRTKILRIRSRDGRGRLDQWAPSLEPKSAAEAIEGWALGLAVHGGLAPSDVQRGSAGQSGYAIVVNRSGQRRIQRKLIPCFRMHDRQKLVMAAKIANVMAAAGLPEDMRAYSLTYHAVERSPDEVRAEIEALTAQQEAGLISRIEAIQKTRGVERKAAQQIALQILTDNATLSAMGEIEGVGQRLLTEAESALDALRSLPASPARADAIDAISEIIEALSGAVPELPEGEE